MKQENEAPEVVNINENHEGLVDKLVESAQKSTTAPKAELSLLKKSEVITEFDGGMPQ